MKSKGPERTGDGGGVRFHPRGEIPLGIFSVRDSQASTGIDVADIVSGVAQVASQGSDALHGFTEGIDIDDLRADMNADASRLEMARGRTLTGEFGRRAHGHPA